MNTLGLLCLSNYLAWSAKETVSSLKPAVPCLLWKQNCVHIVHLPQTIKQLVEHICYWWYLGSTDWFKGNGCVGDTKINDSKVLRSWGPMDHISFLKILQYSFYLKLISLLGSFGVVCLCFVDFFTLYFNGNVSPFPFLSSRFREPWRHAQGTV